MVRRRHSPSDITILASSLSEAGLNKHLYTVPELMRLTGMTRKQVSYWDEIELLKPAIRESAAPTGQPALFYTALEVLKALIFCDMRRRANFSLKTIQQVARNIEEQDIRLDRGEGFILTDGHTVYYANNDNEVVDILKHNRQMLLITIHEQVEKLRNAA